MRAGKQDPKQRLRRLLASHPALADTLDLVWRQAEAGFRGRQIEQWVDACGALAESAQGAAALLAYLRHAPAIARIAGAEAALCLAGAVPEAVRHAGSHAGPSLVEAAATAARRLKSAAAFIDWLRVIDRVAREAPESLTLLLDRTETVLAELDLRGFEAWALGGIRAAAGDPERRLKFFALLDPQARRSLQREAQELRLADVEPRLKAYAMALWRAAPAIRPRTDGDFDQPRRASLSGGIIRLPETYRGYAGRAAVDVFYAALAHALAHLQFSTARFPVGSLKPVQVALVSLIEDARVEQLAMAVYPGLRRLWLPFHVAQPSGALTAPALMARLARGLFDPSYVDDHGWIAKGRALFLDAAPRLDDPGISRAIGGLLGNDLGQMRAQFNAKAYAVEPVYRDDNQGLWDFAGQDSPAAAELLDSVRLEPVDDGTAPGERAAEPPKAEDAAGLAAPVPVGEEVGFPVARYAEWDYLIGRDRADWTTIVEYEVTPGRAGRIEEILERRSAIVHRLTALIRSAKVSRPLRLRRQAEGDRLDLDAAIDAAIDRRLGLSPDPKVYARLERRFRDLSVLLLLDVSQSTNDIVRGTESSVLDLEREAAALLAHAMDGLGDPFALHAFCSDGREDVRYYRVKEFAADYDAAARRRLAGLGGQLSTRIGAALRHAGRELAAQASYRRLLLLITDGEPSDIDVTDRQYLVEDARRAVTALRHQAVDVFCVGLDPGGDAYLRRIFGARSVLQIDRLERLPEKLPLLYFRLTG